MGSWGEYYKTSYADTHTQRVKESMDLARKELVDKYNANDAYITRLQELMKVYEVELTKQQAALEEYQKSRGAKGGATADDTAKLLGVIADAGNTIARETGEAAQRKLEAEGSVVKRYQLTPSQSSAVSGVSSELGAQNINAVTNTTDLNAAIQRAIANKVPAGLFDPSSDASKSAAAELFTTIDRALSSNPVYNANKGQVQSQMQAYISGQLGVSPTYVNRSVVDADKEADVAEAKLEVGKTGTGTSSRAAKLAEDALSGRLGGMTDEQKQAVTAWISSPVGQAYLGEVKETGDYRTAVEKAMTAAGGANPFIIKVGKTDADVTQLMGQPGVPYETSKLFDPAFLDLYSRTKRTKTALEGEGGLREKYGTALERSLKPPTEEEVRRRGAAIYEPISPGIGKRAEEAQRILEAGAQAGDLRKSKGAGTVDDFLASRMVPEAKQLPADERILSGASVLAVQDWKSGTRPKDKDLDRAQTHGKRLYQNLVDKQLRDTSDKAIVQYAADLATGDIEMRDAILRDFYLRQYGDMQAATAVKSYEGVQKAESAPKPPEDISGIKSEELNF